LLQETSWFDTMVTVMTMKRLAIRFIRWYQTHLHSATPRCRYSPTCSNYAIEAYENYSFIVATWLSLMRILRCNPLFKGGYDPIPKKKKLLKEQLRAEHEHNHHESCGHQKNDADQ
jgi:uncharacterized protein